VGLVRPSPPSRPAAREGLFPNPVLTRLDVLSYSIYLIHAPFMLLSLWALRHAWPGTFNGWTARSAAAVTVLTAACFALSELSYRCVERPFLVRKARLDS
jgi:peptidoglycan/LPS O-acetylase OafA/YrhL